jgi:hypothetical protein
MTSTINSTVRLQGRAAIAHAESRGLSLSKYGDPTEDGRDGLTVSEAQEVAHGDPSLIYLDIALKLSPAAAAAVEETGVDPADDVARVCSGKITEDDLLAECLDGADDDRIQGWRDYVTAVAVAAS